MFEVVLGVMCFLELFSWVFYYYLFNVVCLFKPYWRPKSREYRTKRLWLAAMMSFLFCLLIIDLFLAIILPFGECVFYFLGFFLSIS